MKNYIEIKKQENRFTINSENKQNFEESGTVTVNVILGIISALITIRYFYFNVIL